MLPRWLRSRRERKGQRKERAFTPGGPVILSNGADNLSRARSIFVLAGTNLAELERVMAAPYIPAPDAMFSNWLLNFSTLISANPTSFGLVAADATAIAAQNSAFQTAYTAAVDPTTRTSATVAAKDSAKSSALFVVRPYAMRINGSASVNNQQRVDLGLTVRKAVPTPVAPPTSAPALQIIGATPGNVKLGYKDTAQPDGKAKPYGAVAIQLYSVAGVSAAVDPSQAAFMAQVTKSPFLVTFDGSQRGKIATVFGRYVTRSGPGGIAQTGPWSAPLSFTIM